MHISLILTVLSELLLLLFILWGFMHEEMFIRFEDELIALAKEKIRAEKEKKEKSKEGKNTLQFKPNKAILFIGDRKAG